MPLFLASVVPMAVPNFGTSAALFHRKLIGAGALKQAPIWPLNFSGVAAKTCEVTSSGRSHR